MGGKKQSVTIRPSSRLCKPTPAALARGARRTPQHFNPESAAHRPDVKRALCRALPGAADPGSRSVAAQHRSDTGVLQPARRSSIMHGDKAIPQRLLVNGLLCRAEKDEKTKKAEAERGGDVHAQFA